MPLAGGPPLDITHVERVCILCWGLIGDVLVRVPTIEALKRRYPRAHFTVVVDPGSREALTNHPDCDEIFEFSRRKHPWWRYLRGTVSNVLLLRRRRFDLCVNLYSGGTSPRITRIINARIRLGFDHTAALRRANNLRVHLPSMAGNWYKVFGAVLEPLGVAPETIRAGTSFYCSDAARRYAESLLRGREEPLVVFNLGAGSADKRWPVERFAELARHIHQRHGLSPVVLTNPGMESLATDFVEACGNDIRPWRAPRMSLDQVGAVMERCAYVVTGDTSLMHMAFGLKRPTLVLFTYTRPEVVSPEDCLHVDCFIEDPERRDPFGQPAGRSDIPVALVAEKFDALVSLTREGVARLS